MGPQQYQSCIDACNMCADACDYCSSACLQEDGRYAHYWVRPACLWSNSHMHRSRAPLQRPSILRRAPRSPIVNDAAFVLAKTVGGIHQA